MGADSDKFPAWFITFICVFVCVSVVSAQCTDGTYKHDGRNCCLCPAGSYLTEHCLTNQSRGKCEPCRTGMYNSQPNSLMSCEPCTSCLHPNDNLEEAEPCTPATDTKCQCKEDHYCDKDICKLCHPCTKCGQEGIKVRCTGKTDTVCKEKTEGGSSGLIAGIMIVIIVIPILAGVAFFIWKKKKNQAMAPRQENGNPNDVENPLIEDVDLQAHLHDIAGVIGWNDMKAVAMRTKMSTTAIEACQLNHPNDVEEQIVELLRRWVEIQGKGASKNLVEMLRKSDKRAKVENVIKIISPGQS